MSKMMDNPVDNYIPVFPCVLEFYSSSPTENTHKNTSISIDMSSEKNEVFNNLSYFNYENAIIFSRFLVEAINMGNTSEKNNTLFHSFRSYTVFIPCDSLFLKSVLDKLRDYPRIRELSIFLIETHGIYIIPGDINKTVQHIIEVFEKSNPNKNFRSKDLQVYGANKWSNSTMKKFINHKMLKPFSHLENTHTAIITCEIPTLLILFTAFLSKTNNDNNTTTFKQWLESHNKNSASTLFSFFSQNNDNNVQKIIPIFSRGNTNLKINNNGEKITTIGDSLFTTFWKNFVLSNASSHFKEQIMKLSCKNIHHWAENYKNIPHFFSNNKNKKHTKSTAHNDVISTQMIVTMEKLKENKAHTIITEKDIMNALDYFDIQKTSYLSLLKENNLLTTLEEKETRLLCEKILRKTDQSMFYRSMSTLLNNIGLESITSIKLYDFLVLCAVMKNPGEFFGKNNKNKSNLLTAIECISKTAHTSEKLRETTQLIIRISQLENRPQIENKEWDKIIEYYRINKKNTLKNETIGTTQLKLLLSLIIEQTQSHHPTNKKLQYLTKILQGEKIILNKQTR